MSNLLRFLMFFCFIIISRSARSEDKIIASEFCKNFTLNQIPVGDFHQPIQSPLPALRITQKYNNHFSDGYCQVGKGQFSAESKSCAGQKIYYGHDGLDIHPAGDKAGKNNVLSIQSGLVVASHAKGEFEGWGESMIIASRTNLYSEEILTFHYHHLHAVGEGQNYKTTRLFNACESVKSGSAISKEGGTPGWPTHLHLSIKHWKNIDELKKKINKSPGAFYGYGYVFADDKKLANFIDPETLLLDYFQEFNQLQSVYPNWQWSQPDALFVRNEGWDFGLFDGHFGVDEEVSKRQAARMLKIALELPTSNSPPSTFQQFKDINSDDEDYAYINTLIQEPLPIRIVSISHSCTSGGHNFCPDLSISRVEALKMIVAGFYQNEFISLYNNWIWKTAAPLAQNLLSRFNDISPLDWYAPYVYFAWQNKMIGPDENFRPAQKITKAELARWLVFAYKSKHAVAKDICHNIHCDENQYCEHSTGTCWEIPSCLPSDGFSCPLGGGYVIPKSEEISAAGNSSGGSGGSLSIANGTAGSYQTAGSGGVQGAGGKNESNPPQYVGGSGGSGNNQASGGHAGNIISENASGQAGTSDGNQPVCQCAHEKCCDGCNYLPLEFHNSPSTPACYSNPSTSGSPTVCLETKQISDTIWSWRVCKQSGEFSNAYSYQLLDQNHLSQNLGGVFTGKAGSNCSTWHSSDFAYLKSDGPQNGAGLKVEILSPLSCTVQACTYYSDFVSLYRDCFLKETNNV